MIDTLTPSRLRSRFEAAMGIDEARRPPVLGVGAIVVRDDELLMVQRGRAPARGLWSIPGGKVEAGEYLVDALRREVGEETGLDVSVGELAGFFEIVGADDHYVILDFLADPVEDTPPEPGDDVSAVEWVAFDAITARDCTPRLVETLKAWGVLPGG